MTSNSKSMRIKVATTALGLQKNVPAAGGSAQTMDARRSIMSAEDEMNTHVQEDQQNYAVSGGGSTTSSPSSLAMADGHFSNSNLASNSAGPIEQPPLFTITEDEFDDLDDDTEDDDDDDDLDATVRLLDSLQKSGCGNVPSPMDPLDRRDAFPEVRRGAVDDDAINDYVDNNTFTLYDELFQGQENHDQEMSGGLERQSNAPFNSCRWWTSMGRGQCANVPVTRDNNNDQVVYNHQQQQQLYSHQHFQQQQFHHSNPPNQCSSGHYGMTFNNYQQRQLLDVGGGGMSTATPPNSSTSYNNFEEANFGNHHQQQHHGFYDAYSVHQQPCKLSSWPHHQQQQYHYHQQMYPMPVHSSRYSCRSTSGAPSGVASGLHDLSTECPHYATSLGYPLTQGSLDVDTTSNCNNINVQVQQLSHLNQQCLPDHYETRMDLHSLMQVPSGHSHGQGHQTRPTQQPQMFDSNDNVYVVQSASSDAQLMHTSWPMGSSNFVGHRPMPSNQNQNPIYTYPQSMCNVASSTSADNFANVSLQTGSATAATTACPASSGVSQQHQLSTSTSSSTASGLPHQLGLGTLHLPTTSTSTMTVAAVSSYSSSTSLSTSSSAISSSQETIDADVVHQGQGQGTSSGHLPEQSNSSGSDHDQGNGISNLQVVFNAVLEERLESANSLLDLSLQTTLPAPASSNNFLDTVSSDSSKRASATMAATVTRDSSASIGSVVDPAGHTTLTALLRHTNPVPPLPTFASTFGSRAKCIDNCSRKRKSSYTTVRELLEKQKIRTPSSATTTSSVQEPCIFAGHHQAKSSSRAGAEFVAGEMIRPPLPPTNASALGVSYQSKATAVAFPIVFIPTIASGTPERPLMTNIHLLVDKQQQEQAPLCPTATQQQQQQQLQQKQLHHQQLQQTSAASFQRPFTWPRLMRPMIRAVAPMGAAGAPLLRAALLSGGHIRHTAAHCATPVDLRARLPAASGILSLLKHNVGRPPRPTQHVKVQHVPRSQFPLRPSYKVGVAKNFDIKDDFFRPQHYDIKMVTIGTYQSPPQLLPRMTANNKLKVFFAKKRFVYEFLVNSIQLPDHDMVTPHLVDIEVPFDTVNAVHCNNDIILVSVTHPPNLYVTCRPAMRRIDGDQPEPAGGCSNNHTDRGRPTDITNGQLRTNHLHKIYLRNCSPGKLKHTLEKFDSRFTVMMNTPILEVIELGNAAGSSAAGDVGNGTSRQSSERDLLPNPTHPRGRQCLIDVIHPPMGGTSTAIKSKPQKRQEQLDVPAAEACYVCHCQVSCRSYRCSCIKARVMCGGEGHSRCCCKKCDNPLNLLDSFGFQVDECAKDICLIHNVVNYKGDLKKYLEQSLKYPCCGHEVQVKDCVPGAKRCPNRKCTRPSSGPFKFSWCDGKLQDEKERPRNHCSSCRSCQGSIDLHCSACRRCSPLKTTGSRCPDCRGPRDTAYTEIEDIANLLVMLSRQQQSMKRRPPYSTIVAGPLTRTTRRPAVQQQLEAQLLQQRLPPPAASVSATPGSPAKAVITLAQSPPSPPPPSSPPPEAKQEVEAGGENVARPSCDLPSDIFSADVVSTFSDELELASVSTACGADHNEYAAAVIETAPREVDTTGDVTSSTRSPNSQTGD